MSKEPEHTKGKWEANLFTTFKGEVIYAIHAYPEATRIKRVAEVFEEANAHLIAAAPDMYEVLAEAFYWLDTFMQINSGEDNLPGGLFTRIKDALAKAKA